MICTANQLTGFCLMGSLALNRLIFFIEYSQSKIYFISLIGQYQDERGQFKCKICPSGSFCDLSFVPPGQGVIQPQNCSAGYYCLQNTSFQYQYPCPNGTYSIKRSLHNENECTPCDQGFYCAGVGKTNVAKPCEPGISLIY